MIPILYVGEERYKYDVCHIISLGSRSEIMGYRADKGLSRFFLEHWAILKKNGANKKEAMR